MAKTELGAALTQAHRGLLLQLKAATLRDLLTLYPIWKLDDPASYERLVEVTALLVQSRNANASALAAAYYEAFREAEGLVATVAPILAAPPSIGLITAAMAATAFDGVVNALSTGQTVDAAMQNGFVRLSGSVTRQVLDGSRDTILGTAKQDAVFHGWSRVTSGDPCAFCEMLASQGPVYWSEDTAGFEAHDHCSCSAEPWSEGSDWPGQAREFRVQWDQAMEEARGTGKEGLNAFRSFLANQK